MEEYGIEHENPLFQKREEHTVKQGNPGTNLKVHVQDGRLVGVQELHARRDRLRNFCRPSLVHGDLLALDHALRAVQKIVQAAKLGEKKILLRRLSLSAQKLPFSA
jgi:hypothetical protein